jgi:hypothetical protein
MWVVLREEADGAEAPEVSLLADCGVSHFRTYCDESTNSLSGTKWYVYNLLDCGAYYAHHGNATKAFELLAEAGDWIDRLSIKAVRPLLFRNLALAFQATEDFWRMVLAASISVALHTNLRLPEHKAVALLTYLEGLKAVNLRSAFRLVASERVEMEMDNQWALPRLHALAAIA